MTSPPSADRPYDALTRRINANLSTLRADVPDAMKAFGDLARAATQAGALDTKTKELLALALGVAAHCGGCLAFHAKALARLGATRAEVSEVLAMAVYMGGGPSLMYAADAAAAFEEFAAAAG